MKNKIQDLSREELEKLVLQEREKNARLRKKCAKLKKDVEWWEHEEYEWLHDRYMEICKEQEKALNTIRVLEKENSFWMKNADFFEKQYESLVKENANLREKYINLIIEKADASINKLSRDISQMKDFMKQPFNYN